MSSLINLKQRILKADTYRWQGGANACYVIQDKNGSPLFFVWGQHHALMILVLSKLVQK